MLAQNFMTTEELKITDQELSAAISVLRMLERGELVHHERKDVSIFADWEPIIPNGFNMQCSGETNDCGTVACIGGWMAIVMGRKGRDVNSYVNSECSDGLQELFWSKIDEKVSPDQAATALRSYLTTGDPQWDLAVS